MWYQNQYVASLLVHVIHYRNTSNNFFIYIWMPTSQYGNHSLCGDGASLWNKLFKDLFPNHDFTSSLKLKSFLMKGFLQIYKNDLQTSDTRSNNFLSIFSPEQSFVIPTYIYKYSFGSVGDSLDWILHFEVPYHCIVIYISLFIYIEKFVY